MSYAYDTIADIIRLAEENNITYAARRLFMTQPALSERIKKLEKEFNCPIINRQTRGVEFTIKVNALYDTPKICSIPILRYAKSY